MWRGLALIAATEAGANLKQRARSYALYAAGGLVALLGLVFTLIALQIWLSRHMSPVAAGLSVAGLLFAVAVVLFIAARMAIKRKTARFPVNTAAMAMAPVALQAVVRRISMRTIGVLGVVILGALVGRQLSRDEDG